jgi:outer membrane protein
MTLKSLSSPVSLIKYVALLALCLAPLANAQDSKIGFVNTDRVMREAVIAKTAEAKIEQEFSKRNKELQDFSARLSSMAEKLDKDTPVISESERIKRQRELSDLDKDFQRKKRAFSEDLNQRKNDELAGVLERANKVIKQIAESEKYDVILQDAVYASSRIDITEKVIKALNK